MQQVSDTGVPLLRHPMTAVAFPRALDALHLLGLSFFLAASIAGLARGADSSGTAVLLYAVLLAASTALAGRFHGAAPRPRWVESLHLGWTLIVLPIVFTGIRFLVPAFAPGRGFDDALARIDRDWLGVDIPRWSEGFLTPAVADASMLFYFLYFLMPVAAFAMLVAAGDRGRTYRAAFGIGLGVYACYMLYMLVPAAGPRHAHPFSPLSEPLPEGWITGALHDFIRDLEPQPWDAFPSAHVVLGILCAWAAWPFGGWRRWTMAAVAAGTCVSTVVLRYHYLVDDLVSLVVVAIALVATRLIDARVARRAAAAPAPAAAAAGHPDRMADLLGG